MGEGKKEVVKRKGRPQKRGKEYKKNCGLSNIVILA